MAKLTKDEMRQVASLINTSVEDMNSSLNCNPGYYELPVLKKALEVVNRRGEKTKAKILDSKIRKLEKDAEKERKLRLVQQAYD